MKCKKCGKEVEEGIKFCPYCGADMAESATEAAATDTSIFGDNNDFAKTENKQNTYNQNNYNQNNGYNQNPNQNYNPNQNNNPNVKADDAKSVGFGVLSFFFPVIGLILWLVWKAQYPLKAKSCGIGALIGFIMNIVVGIIYGVIIVMAAGAVANGYSALALLML